jgi:hypothetical protein
MEMAKARMIEKNTFVIPKVSFADSPCALIRLSSRLGGGSRIITPQTRSLEQPIFQAAFNGEFGNSREASVRADVPQPRFSKRVARVLWRRNSLRVGIQIWHGA